MQTGKLKNQNNQAYTTIGGELPDATGDFENVVTTTETSYTEEQKAQSRDNLAVISYEEQTLTDAQKSQARSNIGVTAGGSTEVEYATKTTGGIIKVGDNLVMDGEHLTTAKYAEGVNIIVEKPNWSKYWNYIRSDNAVVGETFEIPAPTSVQNSRYVQFEVLAGQTVTIVTAGGYEARAVLVLDKDNVVLEVSAAAQSFSSGSPYVKVAEQDCTYIVNTINDNIYYMYSVVRESSEGVLTTANTKTLASQSLYGEGNISVVGTMNAQYFNAAEQRIARDNISASTLNAARYLDIWQYFSLQAAPKTKIGPFAVTSSTADTITFSEEEYAMLPSDINMTIEFAETIDEEEVVTYRNAIMRKTTGTSMAIYEQWDQDLDLTTAKRTMFIHDTIEGGLGQHLSSFGSKAMAHYVLKESQSIHSIRNTKIGGFASQQLKQAGWENSTFVDVDTNEEFCKTTRTGWTVGGLVNGCSASYSNDNIFDYWTGYSPTAFTVKQENAGSITSEYNLKASLKGYILINAARASRATEFADFNGDVLCEIINTDTLEVLNSFNLPDIMKDTYIDLNDKFYGKNITVKFSSTGACMFGIYNILFYQVNEEVLPYDANSIIQIAADSWSQYPTAGAYYLDESDPFNEMVEYPLGGEGQGFGYFPKQLAKTLGSRIIIDNCSIGGSTAYDALRYLSKMVTSTFKTHWHIAFYVNDNNLIGDTELWRLDIGNLVRQAQKGGAIPMITLPTPTASPLQAQALCRWRDVMLGYDYI